MKISVVTTVLNEREGMQRLLDSLVGQEGPFDVIVVDAGSTDGTLDVIRSHDVELQISLISKEGPRGEGFRTACKAAEGDVLAFIGADDRAAPGWVAAMRDAFANPDVSIVVGHNNLEGVGPKLNRVPWVVDGQDISHAGCNTAYRRTVYHEVGGIDPDFVTAEDMELNLRAVRNGHHIATASAAIVYRTVRPRGKVLNQAFWNGFGRGQLQAKHGNVAGMKRGSMRSLMQPWNLPRLVAGYLGYRKGRRHNQ
jgi:glycosyltransferase involved in cell wall biosynthesis